MSSERKLYITKNWVISLFIYYSILFFVGGVGAFEVLLNRMHDLSILEAAILGSTSISLCASAIAYIRKLYKLCFSYSSEQENADQLSLKQLGTLFYFFTRPFFGLLFSLLIVIGFNAGMILSTRNIELDSGFVYVTMFFSFYAGFLSGDFIKKLEEKGKTQIQKVMG